MKETIDLIILLLMCSSTFYFLRLTSRIERKIKKLEKLHHDILDAHKAILVDVIEFSKKQKKQIHHTRYEFSDN